MTARGYTLSMNGVRLFFNNNRQESEISCYTCSMNLFSHYCFDREEGNAYLNFGLILPDLMGIFKRGWKIPPQKSPGELELASLEIYKGVMKHHRMDRFFHNSRFFDHHAQNIKELLKSRGLENPGYRMFFISHIFLEILLDRVLIQKNKKLLETFYEELFTLKNDRIEFFFKQLKVPAHSNFFSFLGRFQKDKFLYNYLDSQGIIYALNRIFTRVDQPVFQAGQKEIIINCIFEAEHILQDNLDMLRDEIKKSLD